MDQLLAAAGADAAADGGAAGGGDLLTAAAYAMQLTLTLLQTLATRHAGGAAPPPPSAAKAGKKAAPRPPPAAAAAAAPSELFDLGLAVRCAQRAPDPAVRSAALGLVATLAAAAPQAALAHVLDVVAAVGDSAAALSDAHSSLVGAQALGAVARAWVSGGGPLDGLVAAVVAAAPEVPAQRRLPVVGALVAALPEVQGLAAVLAELVERLAEGAVGRAQEASEWAAELGRGLLQQVSRGATAAAAAAAEGAG
jgi:hypothetical protein